MVKHILVLLSFLMSLSLHAETITVSCQFTVQGDEVIGDMPAKCADKIQDHIDGAGNNVTPEDIYRVIDDAAPTRCPSIHYSLLEDRNEGGLIHSMVTPGNLKPPYYTFVVKRFCEK